MVADLQREKIKFILRQETQKKIDKQIAIMKELDKQNRELFGLPAEKTPEEIKIEEEENERSMKRIAAMTPAERL